MAPELSFCQVGDEAYFTKHIAYEAKSLRTSWRRVVTVVDDCLCEEAKTPHMNRGECLSFPLAVPVGPTSP